MIAPQNESLDASFISSDTLRTIQLSCPLPALSDANLRRCVLFRPVGPPTLRKKSFAALALDSREEAREFQRLEYMGDACLGVVISAYLYRQTTSQDDPQLLVACAFNLSCLNEADILFKAFKTHLVNNAVLARLAVTYQLHQNADPPFPNDPGDALNISPTVRKQLADMFEAYAGALWLEQRELAESWAKSVFELIIPDARVAIARRTGRCLEKLPMGLVLD